MGFFKEFGESTSSNNSLNLEDMLESLEDMTLDDAFALIGDAESAEEEFVSPDEDYAKEMESTDEAPDMTRDLARNYNEKTLEEVLADLPDMVFEDNDDDNIEETSIAHETTVISKGTTTLGGISSECSLDVKGVVTGDVECQGKLCIYGTVSGNTSASEIYVDTSEKLVSDLLSMGNVKICEKSVVIGMIQATSAFIAGAVKGDLDIDGPVVVDSSAVIYGNITAKSLQVNSGAVLQGTCNIGLKDTDINSFFED